MGENLLVFLDQLFLLLDEQSLVHVDLLLELGPLGCELNLVFLLLLEELDLHLVHSTLFFEFGKLGFMLQLSFFLLKLLSLKCKLLLHPLLL